MAEVPVVALTDVEQSMNRMSNLVLSAAIAAALTGTSVAVAQPTDACGPASPALALGVPMAGDNTLANTDVFLSSYLCGGFNGSGGLMDVFARFTPTVTGVYRFETCGSAGNTVVSVHGGCPAADENTVGCNDDDCDTASRIDVRLTAGTEYFVRVASNGDELVPGPFTLVVTQIVAPVNDECGGAIAVAPGSSTPGSNVNASGPSMGSCTPDGKDVWYTLPVTTTGVYVIDTEGSDHPDPTVSVWTACQNGVELACNNNDGFSFQSRVAVPLQGGQSYLVRVSGHRDFSGQPAEGSFVLNVSTPQTAVPNDLCSSAAPIAAGSTTAGDTTGATLGGSSTCGDNDFYDVWYSLTVPTRAQYVISLQPSEGFDSTLSMFDGCGEERTTLACANNFDGETITTVLNPGTPYLVRVGGAYHARGSFVLSVDGGTPIPANDTCDQAALLGIGQVSGTTRAATGVDLTPHCASDDSADVWYAFTAPSAGLYTFDTGLSTELTDTTVSAFDGCDGNLLACNDNAGANAAEADFTSRLSLAMAPGQQVLVRVAGANGTSGAFVLRVSGPQVVPAVPTNDMCESAVEITGTSFVHSVDARFATPDLDSECNFGDVELTNYGVWYVFRAAERGMLTFTETGPMQASVTAFFGECGQVFPLVPLQCGEVTTEVYQGDVVHFLVGSEGTEAPASPYVVSATFRPQLGCCTSGATCDLVPLSECAGEWSESLCGFAASRDGVTNLPLTIPNPPPGNVPTFVTSTFEMTEDITLANISVHVNLTHTFAPDVVLRIITPWGATIPVLAGNGGSSFEAGDYEFNDLGLRTLQEMDAGVPLPHRMYPAPSPIGPVVAGRSSLGTWTLSVGDDRRAGAAGRVDGWSISFHAPCGGCPADLGMAGGLPGADGTLDNNDFIAFINDFFNHDGRADLGVAGGLPGHDGAFDNNDFIAFINLFFAGCN